MISQCLLYALEGECIEGVGNVKRHRQRHPSLRHAPFRVGLDTTDGVDSGAAYAESELALRQIGSFADKLLDDAGGHHTLEQLARLIQQHNRAVAGG